MLQVQADAYIELLDQVQAPGLIPEECGAMPESPALIAEMAE